MRDRCGSCIFRGDPEVGHGCTHSPGGAENPMMPNRDELCPFIRSEGKSRWQEKPNPHGKLIVGYETSRAPRDGMIRMPTPSHDDPMSYVIRGDTVRFWLDSQGNCWADQEKTEFVGCIGDFEEEVPSREEIDRVLAEFRKRFNL